MATRYSQPELTKISQGLQGVYDSLSGLQKKGYTDLTQVPQGQDIKTLPNYSAPTSSETPSRTPGLLDEAKQKALMTADTYKEIERQANEYAASQRQARIDAINAAFQPRLDRARQEGDERLNRVAALAFNAGTVGSGVDTTKLGEQKNLNEKELQAIEAEKSLELQKAYTYIDELTQKKTEELTKKTKELADSNVSLYQDKVDKATQALQAFGGSGVSLDDLKSKDPDTYKTLREVGGLSDFEMTSLLNKANPKLNAKLEYKDGVVFQYWTDPKSGEMKIVSQKIKEDVPPDYKAQFAPDGTLIFMPEKFDPSKPYNEQVIVGGKYSKPETPKVDPQEEYRKAQQFVRDNPKATPAELEQGIRSNTKGLSEADIKSLTASKNQFLNKDYFKKLYTPTQLEKAAVEAGFGDDGKGLFNRKTNKTEDYLNYLESVIIQYRQTGYTDQEILKMMQ